VAGLGRLARSPWGDPRRIATPGGSVFHSGPRLYYWELRSYTYSRRGQPGRGGSMGGEGPKLARVETLG